MLKNYCVGCHKFKWFAKQREYFFKGAGTTIKSQGALCGRCFRIIRKAN